MIINTVVSINAINSPKLNKYGIIISNNCFIKLHNSSALYFACGLTVVDSIGLPPPKRLELLDTLGHASVLGVYKQGGRNIISTDIMELKSNIESLYYVESRGKQYVI